MTISIQVLTVVGIICTLSFILNVVLVYYTRISVTKFAQISDGIRTQRDSLESFTEHLKYINELEMYYGDDTLRGLLDHAKSLTESYDQYEEFYNLFDFEEDEESEEEEVNQDGT